MEAKKTGVWRWGINRWLVLALIVLGALAASAFPPVRPHIQLPAEPITGVLFTLPGIGPFRLTNTLVALALADVLVILLGLSVRRAVASGALVLKGISGAVEAMLELLYRLTESSAGRWTRHIFPWMGSIVLLVLVANWMELIPGVDSIGILEPAEHGGYPIRQVGNVAGLPIVSVVPLPKGETEVEGGYQLVPYIRAVSTDLNFTLALALVSVTMTQVYGIRARGLGYFSKFFNFKELVSGSFFGGINFGVGFLELISEFSKILSFTFRLFANIFAGSVLLFVIGSLVPVFAQSIFLILEFFVGMIQAIVFGLLTMIFMAQATAGHGDSGSGH